jgi:peroxiredoxin family protein
MANQKKLALIATKGTLDWAYPPFILASTAAALGNPGMPMPMGMDKWFPTLGTAVPGMEGMMTGMMKSKMKSKGVASVDELRDLCIEADVSLFV